MVGTSKRNLGSEGDRLKKRLSRRSCKIRLVFRLKLNRVFISEYTLKLTYYDYHFK